ncbi:MAG TPA: thioether cross-link-forming SCIFF peptide maturase [Candidatus Gallacutalibacter stercoravium]|nr:thioether cross-link-forming SCIFF peptide maturase [Candidatus Gallacutalibacter stercoravium]
MIHCFQLNGFNLVMDVNSGAVHVLDNCSYDIVSRMDPSLEQMPDSLPQSIRQELSGVYPEQELDAVYAELLQLSKEGMLFSADTYEVFADRMVAAPVKAMCLNIAHDCNLRCEYCFAAKGDFGRGRMLMPASIAKAAIDFLIEQSGMRHNLEVDFFGGEPLMNFDVVKETVEYARKREKECNKNFRFTITTNGLLLTDDKIDFINKEMSNVVLSIDGRKEVNDRLRVSPNGKGSYDAIVPAYQKLVAQRSREKDYYVRGTFTKHNLDFTQDVLHLAQLGFDQISVEPVVSDEKLDYSIKEADLPRVFEEYETLAKTIIERRKEGKGFNFFHFMIDLNQGPCAIKRLRGCGCGNEYVAVTPEGEIYPCHQFVGEDQWKMGDLRDGSFNKDMKKDFALANVYTKEACRNCWAKFYCSGGCNANNWQYEGDIRKAHSISCELEKKRLECAIMIQAALAQA